MEKVEALSRNWWALLVRGLVAIAFAIVAWARPGHTLALVIVVLGAYLIADGVVALAGAGRAARRDDDGWLAGLEGVLGIALGSFTLTRPVTAIAIVFVLIAIWAVCTGALELVEAFRLRRSVHNEWLLGASGLVRLAFGILLFARPGHGALALLWIAAAYALVDGILLVALSFRLRRLGVWRQRRAGPGMTPQPA